MISVVSKLFKISESSTNHEIFKQTVDFLNFVSSFIGCNVLSSNFKLANLWILILVLDFITYMPINIYDLYLFHNDFIRCMFCVVTLGNGFQGGIKLYTFIMKRKNIQRIFTNAEKFIVDTKCCSCSQKYNKWLILSCHIIFALTILFLLAGLLMFIYPAIVYIWRGHRTLHFGFILPAIDPETSVGYLLNFLHHTLQIYSLCIALLYTLNATIFAIMVSLAKYETLYVLLDQLNDLITVRTQDQKKLKEKFVEIMQEHIKLIDYLKLINKIFTTYYFVEILSMAFQTTVTLFTCSVDAHFLPGYPILVIDIFQIFAPCLLGTIYEIQCDKFFDELTKISWIELPLSMQKTVLIMMIQAQRDRSIRCGLIDMNFQAFVMVSLLFL